MNRENRNTVQRCRTLAWLILLLLPFRLWAQEPYTVLSNDDTVLTFYYDDQKAVRGGMNVGPSDLSDDQAWKDNHATITKVVFDTSFAECTSISSTAYWFYGCENLIEIIGMEYLNTANVKKMAGMFQGCSSLTNLDLSSFNTESVMGMQMMFYDCSSLTRLDLSNFNTASVESMSNMFSGCSGLTSLDLSNFKTDNVTNMIHMFDNCSGLKTLDLSSFNTKKVTNMLCMFQGCSSLTNLDMSNFNTEKVTDMCGMFNGCSGLMSLDVSNFNTANVTDMSSMFSGCSCLTSLDLSSFNTANVTDMSDMFYGCSGLTSLDLSNFNTTNVTSMDFMFCDCSGLTSLDLSSFNTEKVTNMCCMFEVCSSLKSLDLSSFNTANVTDMSSMFHGCSGLTSLDLSSFNTANVTDMSNMFYGCFALTSLDLSNFNTESVTDMDLMFVACYSLKSLDLSSFNTANVTNMWLMFSGCSSLTNIDVSGFKTENVTRIDWMFEGCSSLTSLDLSSFNTANVTNMSSMFSGCSKLSNIYVGNAWSTANITDGNDMFTGCTSLVGGSGTTYDENHTDHTYAHIDGGPSNPGYFTDIADSGHENITPMVELKLEVYWDYEQELGITTSWQDEWIYGWDEIDKEIFGEIGYPEPTEYNVRRYYTSDVPNGTHTDVIANTLEGTTMYGEWNFGYWDVLAWSSGEPADGIPSTYFSETLEGVTAYTNQSFQSVPWASSSTHAFHQPDQLFSEYAQAVEINEDLRGFEYDPERSAWIRKLHMALIPNTYIYLPQIILRNNSGKITATDGSAALSGMARLTNLFTGVAGEEAVNVTFYNRFKPSVTNPRTGETVDVVGGRLMTFGIPNQNGNLIRSYDEVTDTQRHLLGIKMQFNNGEDSTFVFDVTEQIRQHWKGGVITVELDMDTIPLPSRDNKKEQLTITLAYDGRKVTMTSEEGAAIYYTLDGSEPTTASMRYSGDGVALTDLCTVKAFAAAEGKTPSALAKLVVHSLFDGTTARVDAEGSLAEAFQWCGGMANAEGLAAIVWNRNDDFPADVASSVQNPNVLLYVNDYTQALGIAIRNVVADGLAQRITLTDNIREDGTRGPSAFYVPQAFRVQNDIKYTRTFSQRTVPGECRGWETIALPFTVQTITHATNGECIPFAAYTAGLKPFWLCELTEQGFKDSENLRANTPYIISMPENEGYSPYYRLAGEVTFSARGIEVPATQLQTSHRGQASFVPCFSTVAQGEAVFALNVGEPRKGFAEGSLFDRDYRDVHPFEAYRTTTQAGVRYMSIADDMGGTTAIREIENSKFKMETVYDLRGVRVKTPGKGIYIRDGKKVVVK